MHTFTSLLTHIVFATKGRRPFLTDDIRERVFRYLAGVSKKLGAPVYRVGGVADHAHLLVDLPARISVAEFLDKLKSNSSGFVHRELGVRDFAWQRGYAAFSVSRSNRDSVAKYIATQEEHHRVRTYEEEVRAFLKAHGISFEKRDLDD